MVMGMAEIKRGESLLIPFRNGKSIYDSQCKPRIYKTRKGFEKHFPGHYLGKDGVELVEYAEVVRCKDCKWMVEFIGKNSGKPCGYGRCDNPIGLMGIVYNESYCSYPEKENP